MSQQACSFLGTLDANRHRGPHVEFPSFENYCLAGDAPELILLGDQATYCLSPACTACPRYRVGQQEQARGANGAFVPFVATAEDAWTQPAPAGRSGLLGLDPRAEPATPDRGHTHWGRLGAGLIFLSVLLCGSFTAAYSGWEWVTRDLRSPAAAGRVNITGSEAAAAPVTPPVFVVMTATPIPIIVGPGASPVAEGNEGAPLADPNAQGGIIPVLPQAVTPTPIQIDPRAAAAISTPSAGEAPEGSEPGAGAPVVDVELLVPTRRPTPVFDVPTSTPAPVEAAAPLPTDTPTATPVPLGTPIILFAPKDKELMTGDCTLVQWNVKNVREVYYENLPMNGLGEREECMKTKDLTFTLLVVLGDGQPQTYTTTVAYLAPTPTVTVTPSFTPEPVFTPTWTPEPPTPTIPPNMLYAVTLAVNGSSELACAVGQTCEVGLIAGNTGSGIDNITVNVLRSDGFAVQLCRGDGVCGGGGVPIANVGAGNTGFVTARFTLPPEATAGSRGTASFQARSDGSGGGIVSDVVTITITVP
jgi:hypothetical protein